MSTGDGSPASACLAVRPGVERPDETGVTKAHSTRPTLLSFDQMTERTESFVSRPASQFSTIQVSARNEQELRLLAGRAIHRPTDMGMQEVVALASAVIAFLDAREARPDGARQVR